MIKAIQNKYYRNSFWLLSNKVIKIVLALVVNILLARYLGAELLGVYHYSISIISFLIPIVDFGLMGLIVKEIHQNPKDEIKNLWNIFILKLSLGLVLALGLIINYIINPTEVNLFMSILSVGLLNQSFSVIQFYFEAHTEGKKNLIAFSVASIIASVLKVVFILLGFSIMSIVWLTVLNSTLASILLIYFFKNYKEQIFNDFEIDFGYIKKITKKSFPLLLSAFASIFYLKIDQVMLKHFSSFKEVGLYAVAAQISEVWYFIPATISAGYFPKILSEFKNKINFQNEIQKLLDFLAIISICISVFIIFASKPLIILMFGEAFTSSSTILTIHICASVFVFSGSVFSKWILAEEKFYYSLKRHIFGAVVNIVLNLYLIPKYGAIGAAISTVISYSISNFFALLFIKQGRWLFWAMFKSYFIYFRLVPKAFHAVKRL